MSMYMIVIMGWRRAFMRSRDVELSRGHGQIVHALAIRFIILGKI